MGSVKEAQPQVRLQGHLERQLQVIILSFNVLQSQSIIWGDQTQGSQPATAWWTI